MAPWRHPTGWGRGLLRCQAGSKVGASATCRCPPRGPVRGREEARGQGRVCAYMPGLHARARGGGSPPALLPLSAITTAPPARSARRPHGCHAQRPSRHQPWHPGAADRRSLLGNTVVCVCRPGGRCCGGRRRAEGRGRARHQPAPGVAASGAGRQRRGRPGAPHSAAAAPAGRLQGGAAGEVHARRGVRGHGRRSLLRRLSVRPPPQLSTRQTASSKPGLLGPPVTNEAPPGSASASSGPRPARPVCG